MTQDSLSSDNQPSDLPARPPANTTQIVGGVWLIAFAGLLFLCGVCSALLYVVTPLTSRAASDDVASGTILGSAALLGVLFGVVMVWQGINLLRNQTPRATASIFPSPIIFLIVLLLAIAIGTGVLAFKSFAVYLFPPWHFLAASCIPLIFVAYAARTLGKTSGFRALFTSFAWGSLGATPLALVSELVVGLVFVIFLAVVISIDPANRALIERWQLDLLRSRGTLDMSSAVQILTNPIVLGLVLIYFSIFVPFLEEAFKTTVVAFIDPRRTKLQDAVLWGIAAGAGFATVENLFNAGTESTVWALAIILRFGATTMHIANGVTMARGWFAARVEGRWNRLVIAFLASVFLHALWNAAAITLGGSAVYAMNKVTSPSDLLQPIVALIGALIVVLIVLTFSGLAWVVYSIKRVREPAL